MSPVQVCQWFQFVVELVPLECAWRRIRAANPQMYLSYHLRITISILLRTYHPTLEPEHLRQERVRQRPHVGPLRVVGGAAVAALGVLPI